MSVSTEAIFRAYDEARKFLGFDTDVTPIPRGELVEQIVAEGYDQGEANDAVDLSVKRGDMVRIKKTVVAVRDGETVQVDSGLRPAHDDPETNECSEKGDDSPEPEASNPRRSATEKNTVNKWGEVDFTDPEPDVWAREWLSRRFWMGRQGKMAYAPWGSRDHPEADEDKNARYKWTTTDNWATKDEVDEWVEKDTRVNGYVVILEKETDPYTDDPDPYAFVDGDDVRCPETGEVHPSFVDLLDRLGMTYADVSTSGSGVHALYEGALPEDVKQAVFDIDAEPWGENDASPSVEIYDGKQVCVVTGDHVPGTPEHVHEWDRDALNEILNEHLDEADRVTPTEGTDTDTQDSLDDYEPKATGATEKTDKINDVFYAVENLTPRDLPLRTKHVGEDSTGWEKWDPSTYRTSDGKDSLHSPPDKSVFYDQKTGRSFGLLSLYAVEQGILMKPWERLEGSDWWDAVEAAREDGAQIPEYEPTEDRREAERYHVLDTDAVEKTGILDDLTDKKRYLRKRFRLPTTREVRDKIDETVKDHMKGGKKTVVEAPTSAGKSYTVATTPWTGFNDVAGGQPVIQMHKTKDARKEAYEDSKEANVSVRELVGRGDGDRGCPIVLGILDEEIKLNGKPPSQWINGKCEDKGLPFSLVHSEAVRRIKEKDPKLLEDVMCPNCHPVTQHEGVPRDDDGNPSVDVIHATHEFAYVPSYLINCNVVLDEEPDYTQDMTRDRVRRAVTAFLQEVDAPLDTFERLLVGRGNEHLEVEEEKVVEALDREPSKSWYFDCDAAHALAPALARAVWYAQDKENGRKEARVYHEPPRFDEEGGGVGVYVTLVLNEKPRRNGDDDATVFVMPKFDMARSVVGLDARPCMENWRQHVAPDMEHDAVLKPEKRRNWRFYERGLRVVQIGEATRPVGSEGKYFDEDGERAVIKRLVEKYGDELLTFGTGKAIEEDVHEMFKDALSGEGVSPKTVESLHYGEEKSLNIADFEDAAVGYVTHCIDPGDDAVLDLVAARDLDAYPERSGECENCDGDGCHECDGKGRKRAHGRGFVGEDADKAADILASVRENHVAQMVGRYARDAVSDDVSVVFVRTDAVPEDLVDVKVKEDVWTFTEKQRAVLDALESLDEPTAREIHEEVREDFETFSKQHVAGTLRKLEAKGHADRNEGAAKFGADKWDAVNEDGLTDAGVVDLGNDEVSLDEIVNSDVWDTYTWSFTILSPTRPDSRRTSSVDRAREDSGGVDPGLNQTLDAFGAD